MSPRTRPDRTEETVPPARGRPEEIELLNDEEEIDASEGQWAPGEPPPGEPLDEVLRVHPESEDASADLLDVREDALELPQPDEGEVVEEVDELEARLESALTRTVPPDHYAEPREAAFDDESVARAAVERSGATARLDEFVCSCCHLRKARAQLADPELRVCHDCAEV